MIHAGYRDLFRHLALADLSDRDRSRIVDLFQEKNAPAGRNLYAAGRESPGLHFVVSGFVKLMRRDSGGASVMMSLAGPGEAFGSCCDPCSPGAAECTAIAQTTVSLLHVPAARLFALRTTEPVVFHSLVGLLCATRRGCIDLAERMAFWPVERRIAGLLLGLARHGRLRGQTGEIPAILNQAEMAQAVGTAREVVTRWLSRFRDQGLIARKGRRIIVLDSDGLAMVGPGVRSGQKRCVAST